MKVTKRIHPGWEEMEEARKATNYDFKSVFGKYQYIYESEKGKISLISLPDYIVKGKKLWEIYCLKGNLFEDVERFDSKKKAEKQIKKYLDK